MQEIKHNFISPDLLQGCGANVELLHWSRLRRATTDIALVTAQLAMLED